MKWCTQIEVRGDEAVGLIDMSMVGDDHEFGLSEDGTRLHVEASAMSAVVGSKPACRCARWPGNGCDGTITAEDLLCDACRSGCGLSSAESFGHVRVIP